MDASKLVEVYVKIRDKRAAIRQAYEEEDKSLSDKLGQLEEALLGVCKDAGVESLRTSAGTATRTVKERVWASDWDAFKKFVREHDAIDLLVHQIHQANFKEWVDSHPDATAPVNIDRKYSITVRRSN